MASENNNNHKTPLENVEAKSNSTVSKPQTNNPQTPKKNSRRSRRDWRLMDSRACNPSEGKTLPNTACDINLTSRKQQPRESPQCQRDYRVNELGQLVRCEDRGETKDKMNCVPSIDAGESNANGVLTEHQLAFSKYVAWFRTLKAQHQMEEIRGLQDELAKLSSME